jgi:type II secretory pathway pseudopilin PulG
MLKQKQRGFTLIEAVVAVAVLITVVVGLYTLLDQGNKLAKQETNVAEAQQSSRIGVYEVSRVIRQARVGGLYFANAILPISNNSGGGVSVTDLSGASHYIRKGTDVIAVRGILSGDKYIFASGDATCASGCATTTSVAVTIHATSVGGVSNFTPGSAPSLIDRTRPFYFVVATASTDIVSVSGSDYLISQYMVGLVDTAGTWYTQTADTFSFTMNPQDSGAKKLNASAAVPASLDKPFLGGPIDEVQFFVDEGATDQSASSLDTHPSLAEATLDASTGNYDIQPLVDEVEDFQVAYGVDGVDGVLPHDKGISPAKVDTTGSNKDEWVGNVANEVSTTLPLSGSDPKYVAAFVDQSVPTGSTEPALAVPALRSVWISLVVKSADPDFVYGGPGSRGMKILDSTVKTFSTATGRPYRRRLQSFAVSLRNYQ